MKKMIVIAVLGAALSISASFGTGKLEIQVIPSYDQRRDAQWSRAQENQRIQQQRLEQQDRYRWQRAQWQLEQRQRVLRRLPYQSYERWLTFHRYDYDHLSVYDRTHRARY
jgi:hypothetical protein